VERISVVIPVINDSLYVYDCIESIFNSTYRNLEVIVISRESLTAQHDVMEEFETDIRLLTADFKSFEEACNLGLKKSEGEFVSLFRVNDINGKMRLELSVKKLEENPAVGMVFCGTTFINEHGKFLSGISRFPKFKKNQFLGKMFEHNWIPTISTVLFRANVLHDIGGLDESFEYAADYDLYLRAGTSSKAEYLDLPLVRYRLASDDHSSKEEIRKQYEVRALLKHDPREIAASLAAVYRKEMDFRISFGRILYKMGLKAEALQQFQRVIFLNDEHIDSYFYSGNCYFDLGDYNNSLKSYMSCLKLNPQHTGCRNNLGILYYYKGDFDRSMAEFVKAVEHNTELFEPKYNLSCLKESESPEMLSFSFIDYAQVDKRKNNSNKKIGIKRSISL